MTPDLAEALVGLVRAAAALTPWAGGLMAVALFFRITDDKPSDLLWGWRRRKGGGG